MKGVRKNVWSYRYITDGAFGDKEKDRYFIRPNRSSKIEERLWT